MAPIQTGLIDVLTLLLGLALILGSSELFTNGVEWLGEKLGLSEGVIGSVLAAVGTALPETLIPIVAVCMGQGKEYTDIGIGAIAGAPFMLSTLTMCVCGTAVMIFSRNGRREPELQINRQVLSRDLSFFIGAYSVGLLSTLATNLLIVRQIVAVLLLLTYAVYLKMTFAHEGESGEVPEHLHFERLFKMGTGTPIIVLQVIAGLAGILIGAGAFVDHIYSLGKVVDIPPIILAMIIAPIATELPEKFNSVIWVRNKKDTLALGNITGAMVFQSCFPVSFGIAFTHWRLGFDTILSGIVALSSATVFLFLIKKDALKFQHMIMAGSCYAVTVAYLLYVYLTD